MLNHVVLFKLKDYPENEKQELLNQIKSALEGLKGKIEELKYIEVGLNHELESKSFDICLISHFENADDLQAYQVHPEHVKVGELIRSAAASRAAVDFEF